MKKETANARVQITPSLKRKIAIIAAKRGTTEGSVVEDAIINIVKRAHRRGGDN